MIFLNSFNRNFQVFCYTLLYFIGHEQMNILMFRCVTVDKFRVISGDYRGFVMIWDMEDIQREMWDCERKQRQKSSKTKSTISGIYKMQGRQVVQSGSDTCEVLQHSSLLEHHGKTYLFHRVYQKISVCNM